MSKRFFNNDSFELIIRPKSEQLLVIPIGYHLNFRLFVQGEKIILKQKTLLNFDFFLTSFTGSDVVRSYTPIPANYSAKEAIKKPPNLLFLIKTYSTGTLSKQLALKTSDDVVFVSQPKGSLDLLRLRHHTRFAMIAAGSGITPMFSVLEHLLDRSSFKM